MPEGTRTAVLNCEQAAPQAGSLSPPARLHVPQRASPMPTRRHFVRGSVSVERGNPESDVSVARVISFYGALDRLLLQVSSSSSTALRQHQENVDGFKSRVSSQMSLRFYLSWNGNL